MSVTRLSPSILALLRAVPRFFLQGSPERAAALRHILFHVPPSEYEDQIVDSVAKAFTNSEVGSRAARKARGVVTDMEYHLSWTGFERGEWWQEAGNGAGWGG